MRNFFRHLSIYSLRTGPPIFRTQSSDLMILKYRCDKYPCILIYIVDTDDCKLPESNNCDENALCTNTAGSYVCQCNEGYTGNGTFCQGNYVKCGIIFLISFLLKMNSFSRIFTNPSLPYYRCYILEGRCVLGDVFYVSM